MWATTSDAQDQVISNEIPLNICTEEHTMISLPETFLTAEITYLQARASQLYGKKPSRRRRWVPRLPSLALRGRRRRSVAMA